MPSRHCARVPNASAKKPRLARRSAPSEISGWYGASRGGYQNRGGFSLPKKQFVRYSSASPPERYSTAARFAAFWVTTPPRPGASSPSANAPSIVARGRRRAPSRSGATLFASSPIVALASAVESSSKAASNAWNKDSHVQRIRGTFATRASALRHTAEATPSSSSSVPRTRSARFGAADPITRSADLGTTLCHVPGGT